MKDQISRQVALARLRRAPVTQGLQAQLGLRREHLVGAAGTVVDSCDPDGFVDIQGAVWKARAHRGRIAAGAPVKVRAVNGLLLEIDLDTPTSVGEPAEASG